jgi:hypothetical protein
VGPFLAFVERLTMMPMEGGKEPIKNMDLINQSELFTTSN